MSDRNENKQLKNMKTLTIHFDDENISKDINLDSLDGCFYDGGNDPYKPVKCCEICYAEYINGENVEENVLYFLEYLIEDSGKLHELNDVQDMIDYLEYSTEAIYK